MSKESDLAESVRMIRNVHAHIAQDRIHGEKALRRLLPIALGDTGQSNRVARLLLGCYNGTRFPFDLCNLRSLDYEIMNDCLAVLRMDANALQEVHCYFDKGGKIFETLAKRFDCVEEVRK